MLFEDWLSDASKVILFDGAMGTELFKRGVEPGQVPDVLNSEQPKVVQEILKSYYDAGSDMVQSCTFGSNGVNLERHQIPDRLIDINTHALKNIRSICPSGKLIVGDIGPSGEFRPPVGSATGEQWQIGFQKQAEILASGVDVWHIETMSDIEEMVSAIQAIRKFSDKPIIASMTYRKTKRGFFTIMGDSLEGCINRLEAEKVDVIGMNCTLGSADMVGLAQEAVQLTECPLSVKPNAGQPRLEGGQTTYDQSPENFVMDVKKIIEAGARIVGGCCGTSPTHIKLLRQIIDSL
ncbi:MAG: homocysteine S-methyltransferase family protein [Candidatus Hodarchaeota archaeon]